MKQNVHDYDIECITETDFVMTLTYFAGAPLINNILRMTKNHLRKVYTMKLDDYPRFELPVKNRGLFTKVLDRYLFKDMRNHIKEFKRDKDGITVIEWKVENAHFIKQKNGWQIEIMIKGLYVPVK